MSTGKTKRKKNLLVDHSAWVERLSKEWDWEKNDEMGIEPDEVTVGSGKQVWWIGSECGHEWQQSIVVRTRQGHGCPYCSGRRVMGGFNDLASQCPDFAEEWHPTRNGLLKPENISAGSGKKAWWLGKCGHEWEATIHSRTSHGTGCPFCSGQNVLGGFNDLTTTNPEISSEWHPNKNGRLMPQDFTSGSGKKVWWLGKCGHEWEATIHSRVAQGSGCPYCSGQKVLPGFNDLETAFPEIAAEWHPNRNGALTPRDVYYRSRRVVWWMGQCGHEWKQSVVNRTRNCQGCPHCHSSRGEKDSATWAHSVGFVIDEQWRHEGCRDRRPLPFDLMLYVPAGNALMEASVIEYDGEQHSNPESYYNQKGLCFRQGHDYVKRHDDIKDNFCLLTDRLLIRIPHTVKGVDAIGTYLEEQLRANGWGWWIGDVGGGAANPRWLS